LVVETSNPKYEAPGWDAIYQMLLDLAQQIRKDQYKPEIIVGVSRGGWPPARVMSDLLQNPNLANLKVEFYRDIGVRNKKPRITQPVTMEVVGKRVLVVDDVSDTGHSLRVGQMENVIPTFTSNLIQNWELKNTLRCLDRLAASDGRHWMSSVRIRMILR